jgi:hypothetical protein
MKPPTQPPQHVFYPDYYFTLFHLVMGRQSWNPDVVRFGIPLRDWTNSDWEVLAGQNRRDTRGSTLTGTAWRGGLDLRACGFPRDSLRVG